MLDRLRVLKEVATGLYQLHAIGLVHGDLKLDNVLLASGAEPRVRLADFGLATLRAQADRTSRISTLALTDAKRGTYSYMAPEMFASRTARAAAASRSTDVFAFGTLAWELLSSRLAWEGQTEGARALALARGESLSAAALPLETPNSVGALVARCMALERRDRPRMAEAMAALEQAHENLLSGRFVSRAARPGAGADVACEASSCVLLTSAPRRLPPRRLPRPRRTSSSAMRGAAPARASRWPTRSTWRCARRA